MRAAYVTIGRGAGHRRLSDDNWHNFIAATRRVLRHAGAVGDTTIATEVVGNHGQGEWDGEVEDNFIVGYIYPAGLNVDRLREDLAFVATIYNQDAIAYIAGESVLVGPNEEAPA